MNTYEIILRLALACFLGALIGLERQSLSRPAGLRTYTLVCVGSALAMIVSLEMYYQYRGTVNADPGRIAAQVVSGIGFLGAGTIIREGATIRGLTTAAGLWAVACIGLAVGAGMYIPAIVTTVFILLVLIYFVKFEDRFTGLRSYKAFSMKVEDRPGQIGRVGHALGDMEVLIKNIQLSRTQTDGMLEIELLADLPSGVDACHVVEALSKVDGVRGIERIN